jgi:hypothetical protein
MPLSHNFQHNKCRNRGKNKKRRQRHFATTIASIFSVASAIFHENIVCPCSQQAEPFIPLNPWLSKISTAPYVLPDPMYCNHVFLSILQGSSGLTFLPNFSAHRRFNSRQEFQMLLFAIGYCECRIVERIGAFGVGIRTAVPALDGPPYNNITSKFHLKLSTWSPNPQKTVRSC